MTGLMALALRRSLNGIEHVVPVRPAGASGLVARVYRQVEGEFGLLAPPIALHSPVPGVLAASWLMLRETLLAAGSLDRASKEAIAAAVSAANACPYCVEVHTAALGDAEVDDEWSAWAARSGDRDRAGAAPGPAAWLPEALGVVTTFHYLNRMVTIFLPESPLPAGLPTAVKGTARRMLTRIMAPEEIRRAGESLDLLPPAALPADLAWAEPNPAIGAAFARACAAIDAAALNVVPAPVRVLVRDELAAWTGRPPGLGRGWVEDAVAVAPQADRAIARLGLLTALAPFQVDEEVIAQARKRLAAEDGAAGADAALIALTAWASLTTARRIGAWAPAAPVPDRPAP